MARDVSPFDRVQSGDRQAMFPLEVVKCWAEERAKKVLKSPSCMS